MRQGHPGLSFYFILSGAVTAEVTEVDKHTGKDVLSLETGLICILLSAKRIVHFDKRRIRFLLKWSIVKSTSEPKPQRKAYHIKDTTLK